MNKKQTAVMELIEYCESKIQYHKKSNRMYSIYKKQAFVELKEKAIELLPKDKQQIIESWNERDKDVIKSDGKNGKQYFTETYGTK